MQIRQQNHNFGAIKIEGFSESTEAGKKIIRFTEAEKLKIEYGLDFWSKPSTYICTMKDSWKEKRLMDEIKLFTRNESNVSVNSCSDKEAKSNTIRWRGGSISAGDIFRFLFGDFSGDDEIL